jgi:hypothetical protein
MAGTFLDLFRGMGAGNAGGTQTPAAAPQRAQAGGFLSGLNPDVLMAIGTGLLTGKTPQDQIGGALTNFAQVRKDQRQRNLTLEILGKDSPQLVRAVEAGVLTPSDAFSLHYKEAQEAKKAQRPSRKFQTLPDGTFGWADENAGTWTPLGTAPKAKTQPALAQEYQFAKENGFEGGFTDYVQLKKSGGANGGQGGKAPSGYRWTDDTQSALEPIPGGPGEETPGELAARIGMAKSFLERAPALRQRLAQGDVTGPWDQRMARNGIGDKGQVYQELESGVDVLMRLLTGAGMNQTEAEAYARRYLPGTMDTAETAVQKLDRLTAELQATASEAGKGRGGFQSPQQGSGRIDALVKKYGG